MGTYCIAQEMLTAVWGPQWEGDLACCRLRGGKESDKTG